MKQIILAWLNANGTNEQKSLEIEYQCEKFAIGFGKWMINNAEKYNEYLYQIQDLKELLEIYKKEKENE